MSDFISDLEAELVAAARRRAGRRRRVVLVPRLGPATVLAVVASAALLLAAVALMRGLDGGSRTADERPSVPPEPGVALALPAAEAARSCPGVEQRIEAAEAAQSFPLGIFTRPRIEADALPSPTGAGSYSWIPAGTIFHGASRRPAAEQFDAELHLVPIAEPRQGGGCSGALDAVLGVCLLVDADDTVVKCFSDDEIAAGRAVALTSPGVVHGIAPDGVGRVTLHAGGQTVAADVHENAYELNTPVAAGDEIRLELERLQECRPSADLLDALPALRDGTWQTLPAPAGGPQQWARRIETGDELELWAIAHCDAAERACVLAVHGGNQVAQPCTSARDLSMHGTSETFPVAGRLGVAGMAPPGTRGVQVVSGDHVYDVPLTGGVFGGLLPPAFGSSVDLETFRVRYMR